MKIQTTHISNPQVQTSKIRETKTQLSANVRPKKDSVEISVPAQARQLKQQGQTISEIAIKLGVSVQIVNQYLGVGQKQA